MQQEQPQYYRAVPVSEKPKKSGYYLTPLGKIYYSSRKEAFMVRKPTHYLQPIPIPDAAVLRSALEEVRHHIDTWPDEPERAVRLAAKVIDTALSAGDGWVRVDSGKLPEPRIRVIVSFDVGGYDIGHVNHDDKTWRDDDDNTFNPAFPVTHWRHLPSPPLNK